MPSDVSVNQVADDWSSAIQCLSVLDSSSGESRPLGCYVLQMQTEI